MRRHRHRINYSLRLCRMRLAISNSQVSSCVSYAARRIEEEIEAIERTKRDLAALRASITASCQEIPGYSPSPQPWSEAEVESLITGRRKGRSFLELADELGRSAGRCTSRYHHEIRKRNLAKQKRRKLAARGAV